MRINEIKEKFEDQLQTTEAKTYLSEIDYDHELEFFIEWELQGINKTDELMDALEYMRDERCYRQDMELNIMDKEVC